VLPTLPSRLHATSGPARSAQR